MDHELEQWILDANDPNWPVGGGGIGHSPDDREPYIWAKNKSLQKRILGRELPMKVVKPKPKVQKKRKPELHGLEELKRMINSKYHE